MGCEMSKNLKSISRSFFENEEGATAIEYGLIAAGIALAIVAAMQLAGTSLNSAFNSVASILS